MSSVRERLSRMKGEETATSERASATVAERIERMKAAVPPKKEAVQFTPPKSPARVERPYQYATAPTVQRSTPKTEPTQEEIWKAAATESRKASHDVEIARRGRDSTKNLRVVEKEAKRQFEIADAPYRVAEEENKAIGRALHEAKVDRLKLNPVFRGMEKSPALLAQQKAADEKIAALDAQYKNGTLVRAKELVDIPIMAIIRPRMSGFLYSDEDFNAMCIDAKTLLQAGADGIVFGFLNSDATLDYERTARFKELAGDKQTVFHRAIDIINDRDTAVNQLIKLDITRILTSGSMENVIAGIDTIKYLQATYGEKIEVLAGGGVRADGVADLIAKTGVKQVHFGGTSLQTDPSALFNSKIAFGSTVCPPNECYIAVDSNNVKAIMSQI